MAVPVYSTDLTDIIVNPTGTTGFTALGGGASGLPSSGETDFYIQPTSCMSKAAWTNAIKGFIYDNGSTITVPTDGAILVWGVYFAAASLEVRNPGAGSPGGLMVIVGSGTGDYWRFNVAGSDNLEFDSWIPFVVNPDNSLHDGGTVGTPSGTEQFVGILANLPTTAGPTKGNPIGFDAVRYGRCTFEYTNGSLADGYATFTGANAFGNDPSRRWGLLELKSGVYNVQGFHSFGLSGTAVEFVDSNKKLFIRDTARHVTSAFNRFELLNASSVLTWTNISIDSLSTVSKGTFVQTAGTLTFTDCQFTDMGTFTFTSSATVTGTTFRRCLAITAPGSTMTGCIYAASAVDSDTSALIWNVATDPDGYLDDSTFSKGANSHHAIELGTTSPTSVTLRNIAFGTDFSATNGQTNSTIHVKRTTGSVTINLVGCSGNISYKTDGASVTLVTNPVTLKVIARNVDDNSLITGARVFAAVTSGINWPYLASVSITGSGTTATVTHTAHGLATNDYVWIKGANEDVYNGQYQITVTGTNSYTYTTNETIGSSPATGTITSTFVLLSGTTDGAGQISDTRTYANDQPIAGWVRKSTSSPLYRQGPISDTVSSTAGKEITVYLIPDE